MPNRIIFCDIDGVLNKKDWEIDKDAAWIEQPHASILSNLLKITDAGLVISSQRRGGFAAIGNDSSQFLLRSHGIVTSFFAVTDPGEWQQRKKLIRRWIKKNSPNEFVILDDTDTGFEKKDNFIKIDPRLGLTSHDATQAMKHFSI